MLPNSALTESLAVMQIARTACGVALSLFLAGCIGIGHIQVSIPEAEVSVTPSDFVTVSGLQTDDQGAIVRVSMKVGT